MRTRRRAICISDRDGSGRGAGRHESLDGISRRGRNSSGGAVECHRICRWSSTKSEPIDCDRRPDGSTRRRDEKDADTPGTLGRLRDRQNIPDCIVGID